MAGTITRQDERVRVRAYHLWEQAGRPHGRNDEFWEKALLEIVQEAEKSIHLLNTATGAMPSSQPGAPRRSK